MSEAVIPETRPGEGPSQLVAAGAGTRSRKPLVLLVVGMAGTGKTSLVHRLQHHAVATGRSSYFVNLDPAVSDVPFHCNIDIRDTVNYREVMQQYRLGPNGAILTALNLFATKFHQVVEILEKKTDVEWIIIDTPGQIEVFTWSASGQLITEALAATFPTALLFVADTTRCINPQTFMSTMLYSSSIMLKTQLPLLLVLNKTDVVSGEGVVQWMRDSDALSDAIRSSRAGGGSGGASSGVGGLSAGAGTSSYASTLTQSLALFVHEYYETLQVACVSAASGAGMADLERSMDAARDEYEREFGPLLAERAKRENEAALKRAAEQLNAFKADKGDEASPGSR